MNQNEILDFGDDQLRHRTDAENSEINALANDYLRQQKPAQQGRIALGFVAGMTLLSIALSGSAFVANLNTSDFWFGVVFMAVIFGGLLAWSFKDRFWPFAIGLGLYILDWAVSAFTVPELAVRGILMKIIVILFLYRATKAGWEKRQTLRRAHELGVSEAQLAEHFN